MSMICCLRQATDDSIAQLVENPKLIHRFISGDDYKPPAKQSGGIVAWLFGTRMPAPVDQPVADTIKFSRFDDDEIDLDKAWHGIHFLLTGAAWEGEEPLNFLAEGGEPVGTEDVGYGPARVFDSQKVVELAGALAAVSEEDLRMRFDPRTMMDEGIYPTIWDRDPKEDDTLGYLMEFFGPLKEFVLRARQKKLGVVVWLS